MENTHQARRKTQTAPTGDKKMEHVNAQNLEIVSASLAYAGIAFFAVIVFLTAKDA